MRKTLKKPSYRPLNISNYLFEDDSIDGIIDWREKLKPAETLGKPDKDAQMANDEACAYGILCREKRRDGK